MDMRNLIAVVVVLGLAPSSPAGAQQPGALQRGEAVRITYHDAGRDLHEEEGGLISIDDGGITIERQADVTHHFTPDRVRTLEVMAGKTSRGRKGALVGGAIGAGAGLTVGLVAFVLDAYGDCPFSFSSCTVREGGIHRDTIATGVATVGLGVLGAIIVSNMHKDRWVEVPWRGVHVGVQPTFAPGPGLTARLRF